MARRKESGLNFVASLPWPVGVVMGIAAFLSIRYGLGWYFSAHGGPLLRAFGDQASKGAFTPLAWVVMVAFWLAAMVSFIKARDRRRLLDTQSDLNSLTSLSWQEFEMLVGEWFRRCGYAVTENGLGGKDGGIDLIVSKEGRTELVQCKQWRTRQIKVTTVREMWGLVDHYRAHGVYIVCIGNFTHDAARFAEGKAIKLINGTQFLELVKEVQSETKLAGIEPVIGAPSAVAPPICPAHLWTLGYVPRLKTYTGWEVPNALEIIISKGAADIRQVCADVLALTKLNFNSCIYGDGIPVTLRFANAVGEILTAAPTNEQSRALSFRHYI